MRRSTWSPSIVLLLVVAMLVRAAAAIRPPPRHRLDKRAAIDGTIHRAVCCAIGRPGERVGECCGGLRVGYAGGRALGKVSATLRARRVRQPRRPARRARRARPAPWPGRR
ncbi:MAG: hypothetical protein U0841_29795 [Chloroflexia bacterium]